MKIKDLADKSILVLGLGREGQVALEFFKKHFPEKQIGAADQNQGENYLDILKDYQVIIKSPGIPYLPEIVAAKNAGKIITSVTDIFFENCKGTIIGVTGTKGKSTTSSLIYEVLKAGGLDVYLVGNIGTPALDVLEKINEHSWMVFELSSFQLSDLTKSPHIAVWTNFYPEHLDYHGSENAYFDAKANITKYQNENDYFIYNKEFEELEKVSQISKARKLPFSLMEADQALSGIINKNEIPLPGDSNILNILPSIIIGKLLKISSDKIGSAIKNFKPLPHRLEFVSEKNSIKFYNDSLATIPQATVGALEALGDDVETLIVGGFDRGLDYSTLGEAITQSNVKNLILFPDTGQKIWQAVCNFAPENARPQKFDADSMEEAVKKAFRATSPGKIVLLSPASSSFNMFKDYADRGDQFKKFVLGY